VFFFQAEDGIRGLIVTGVQTCALPISSGRGDASERVLRACETATRDQDSTGDSGRGMKQMSRMSRARSATSIRPADSGLDSSIKIGRASCRERGEISVVDGAVKKRRKE